jgi:hypothetical protein
MNEQEKRVAEALYGAIQDMTNNSERGLQSQEFRLGVSDIGFCSERARRMLDQQVPEATDMMKAWIGTALGDHAEQAALRVWPNAIRQAEVTLHLRGENHTYDLTGHPDLIVPHETLLLDFKTDYGLITIERTGPSDSQQFQRHGYAKAAWDEGLFGDTPLEEVMVGNAWIDRSGIEDRLHVQIEPYDQKWVDLAGAWLDDVVYAYLNQEEARKEPPRDMCAVVCGFYPVCRAYDTDVEGLIRDQLSLTAVSMYREGMGLEKAGKKLKDEAKAHLKGVSGSTGEFLVRWTHHNESTVPEQTRRAYDKLEVREIPKPKPKKK